MKLLLLPLLLVGAGWYGLSARASDPSTAPAAPRACDPADCHVTVQCTDRDTCIVTCTADDGSVICQEELPCDAKCVPGAAKLAVPTPPTPCCSPVSPASDR